MNYYEQNKEQIVQYLSYGCKSKDTPLCYGVELEQYVGKDLGFISASIENELREALCQDDRISDVQVNNISKGEQENSCLIEFTVFTKYGNIEEELNVLNTLKMPSSAHAHATF